MSYTLVLEWMPGDLYMSAVTARCTAPTSSYSVVWLPPNKVYQITLYCGSTSLVSFLVGAFRGKAWSYMRQAKPNEERRQMEEYMISKEEIDELVRRWPQLDDRSKLLLEGKYILGKSDEELAEELSIKPASVRMALTRARQCAYQLLTDEQLPSRS